LVQVEQRVKPWQPKSDQQDSTHFIKHVMCMSKKPSRKQDENVEKLEIRWLKNKTGNERERTENRWHLQCFCSKPKGCALGSRAEPVARPLPRTASAAENGEGQRALGAEDENLGVAGQNENRKSDRCTLSARSDAKKKT
jgi:hypothetical protein